jgi:hypothetical protein
MFLVLVFAGLLTGCFKPACADPDAISEKWVPQCFYHLKVVETDPTNSMVKAQYAEDYRQDKTKALPSYTFRVRDLDHLKLETGKDYYFIRQGSSPFLEPFYQKPKCTYEHKDGKTYECPEY